MSFELIPFRFCFVGWFRLLRDLWRLGFGTELEGQWWIRALSAERGREECWKWGRGRREGGGEKAASWAGPFDFHAVPRGLR